MAVFFVELGTRDKVAGVITLAGKCDISPATASSAKDLSFAVGVYQASSPYTCPHLHIQLRAFEDCVVLLRDIGRGSGIIISLAQAHYIFRPKRTATYVSTTKGPSFHSSLITSVKPHHWPTRDSTYVEAVCFGLVKNNL